MKRLPLTKEDDEEKKKLTKLQGRVPGKVQVSLPVELKLLNGSDEVGNGVGHLNLLLSVHEAAQVQVVILQHALLP